MNPVSPVAIGDFSLPNTRSMALAIEWIPPQAASTCRA